MNFRSLIIISAISLFSLSLNAQCIDGLKTFPIYVEGADYVEYLDSVGMEIVRLEYDLIFTEKESYRVLFSDWEYLIFCFIDDGVKSFHISLNEYDSVNEIWFPVSFSDESDSGSAALIYQPAENKQFKVIIEINEFNEGYSAARYGLIYVHD